MNSNFWNGVAGFVTALLVTLVIFGWSACMVQQGFEQGYRCGTLHEDCNRH